MRHDLHTYSAVSYVKSPFRVQKNNITSGKLTKYTRRKKIGNVCSLWLTYAFLVISKGAFHRDATLKPF
jgi:hypothetical protein